MYRTCKKKLLVSFMVFSMIFCSLPIGYSSFADDAQKLYEAENGLLQGTEISYAHSGFSGTGYVSGFDNADDCLRVYVEAEKRSFYNLRICYSSEFGDAVNNLFINGNSQGSILFRKASSFTVDLVGKIWLHEGLNEIRLSQKSGCADIDYIKIGEASNVNKSDPSNVLINPNASSQARELNKFLHEVYGDAIISGQQNIEKTNWIGGITGKEPAITTFDLVDYTGEDANRAGYGETEKALDWAKKGGIVSFNWTWNTPKNEIEEGGNLSPFDIEEALINPESPQCRTLLKDIEAVALQLLKLQDKGVPVLWRPFKGAQEEGNWLGAKGAGVYKSLYKLLYKELTETYNLNNLIWVWTAASDKEDALNWYPGDGYVDIVSADIQLNQRDYSASSVVYRNIVSLFGGRKLVTMSENTTLPDPDKIIPEVADWSWFCTSEEGIDNPSENELDHLIKVYNSEYVITLDELSEYNYNPTTTDHSATSTPITTPSVTPKPTSVFSATSMPTTVSSATSTPTTVSSGTSTPGNISTPTREVRPTPTGKTNPTPSGTENPKYGYTLSGYILPDFQYKPDSAPILKSDFKIKILDTTLCANTDTTGYFEIHGVLYCKDGYNIKINKMGFLARKVEKVVVTGDTKLSISVSPIMMWGGDVPDKGVQDDALNMKDIMLVASRFNTRQSSDKYVYDFDIDKDGAINMIDIMIIAKHFNRRYGDNF